MYKVILTFLFSLFLLLPKVTLGLAGFAERDYEFNYSQKILIEFNAPSDSCPLEFSKNQECILLYHSEKEFGTHPKYKNLDQLTQVNLPQRSDPTLIIGKSYINSNWLLYDLKNDKLVLGEDKSYDTVEKEWENLGNSKPEFVNTDNYSKYFHNQTEDSKHRNSELDKFGWTIILGILVFLFGVPISILILLYLIKKLYKKFSHRN